MKRFLVCLMVFAFSLGLTAFASGEVSESDYEINPATDSITGNFISEAARGASALYVSGGTYMFDDSFFYGAGTVEDTDASDEIANQYGFCSAVLANSSAADLTLNEPLIVTAVDSYSNGVFAANYAKITVNGGMIDTANSQGHGIDVTFGGKVYANHTMISTRGSSSAALASDYGGGFILADSVKAVTQRKGSPGIYCAGSSIIYCTDCVFRAVAAEGVMCAHSDGVTVLKDCDVYGYESALNGHGNISSIPTYCYVFGGSLSSGDDSPIINESNGNNVVTLVGVDCQAKGAGNVIATEDDAGSVLTVNVWDTRLVGNIYAGVGSVITLNLYSGGAIAGDVFGDGEVVINVWEGGDFHDFGEFPVNTMGESPAAPECGDFDYYLENYWALGSQWNGTTLDKFIGEVEEIILENSALSFTDGSTATAEYRPDVNDPSEKGIDLSLLNTSNYRDPNAVFEPDLGPILAAETPWDAYIVYCDEQIHGLLMSNAIDMALNSLYTESNPDDPDGWPFTMLMNEGTVVSYSEFLETIYEPALKSGGMSS